MAKTSCLLGRTLLPGDMAPQADPVAVITYRFWERGFGLDPGIVGRGITVNQYSFTVVGVLPRGYCGPQVGDFANVYVPMSAQAMLVPEHPLAARILRAVLFGVRTGAPVTLAVTVLLVVLLAAVAAWMPARRAAKVDPLVALRNE